MKPAFVLAVVAALAPFSGAAEFQLGIHKFALPEGFTVERVAGPGLVDRPIVADFDEQGRLYVAESSGSNDPVDKQLKEKPHRILRLEDSDSDGNFDKSIVFADKMMFPEGAMWLAGSLYVSAPPIIWKLTDIDNDGVADKREEWLDAKTLTGCANDLHGPYLGLDGWIYWCKGAFAKQEYERPGAVPFQTRAAHIFRRRPDGGIVEAVMTGGMDNPVDVAFTPEGERIFTTTFFQHPGGGQRDGLIHAIYGGVYGKVHDVIDDHKKTGELMPVLTHLGPAAPSGLTRYESDVFGLEYRDNLFAALFNLHKVTRHVLQPVGATYQTVDSDFLVSDQTDFHPTDVIEDADGSLLVIDTGGWYKLCCPTSQLWKPDVLGAIYRIRRTAAPKIEDPRGLKLDFAKADTKSLAQMLGDPRTAVRRRAIEALRNQKSTALTLVNLFRTSVSELQQRNAVWALSSARDPQAPNALSAVLSSSFPESVRHAALHAMAVDSATANLEALLNVLESSDSPALRRAAAEAIGRKRDKAAVPALLQAAAALPLGENSLPDRVQEHSVIYALIEISAPESIRKQLESQGEKSPALNRAALIALDQMGPDTLKPADVIPHLTSANPTLRQTANWIVAHRPDWGADLAGYYEGELKQMNRSERALNEMINQISALVRNEAVAAMVSKLAGEPNGNRSTREAMLGVMERARLRDTPESWRKGVVALLKADLSEPQAISAAAAFRFKEVPDDLKTELEAAAANPALPIHTRLQAVGALGANAKLNKAAFNLVRSQLAPGSASNDRRLAASIISRAALTTEQLGELTEAVRQAGPLEMSSLLTAYEKESNEVVGDKLFTALKIAKSHAALTPDQLQRAFAKFPPKVKDQAAQFATELNTDAAHQKARIEALLPKMKDGDIRRGQAIFNSQTAACSTCHAIGYLGGDIGPDLTRIGQVRTERDLLEAILFPSASFVRSYEPVIVETKDGDVFNGVLRKDAADEIILGTGPGAEVRVARTDVAETRPGQLSLMPQGLDEQLTTEQLADLVAFLKATRW
jgi:putative membrane-bound dehydrogenase-like protein